MQMLVSYFAGKQVSGGHQDGSLDDLISHCWTLCVGSSDERRTCGPVLTIKGFKIGKDQH